MNDLLPTVKFGPHEVTRLILGGNPIYGWSHFNRPLSDAMRRHHSPERVVELLQHTVAEGVNTWQNSYSDRVLSDLARAREAGVKFHWFLLGNGDWETKSKFTAEFPAHKPIGVSPHGWLNERLHREKKLDQITDILKRIRDAGLLVGLSAHDPALLETSEEKGWDVDYYMCSLYYLSRSREQWQRVLGTDLPLGEIYLPSDPPKMFAMIQQTRKPCLVYKVFAAGRTVESADQVRKSLETAYKNIKPSDALIVGMTTQFSDQVAENTAYARKILAKG